MSIFYRHYDMKERVDRSIAHHWFLTITPMTSVSPIRTAVMDDFGFPQVIDYTALAASVANSDH